MSDLRAALLDAGFKPTPKSNKPKTPKITFNYITPELREECEDYHRQCMVRDQAFDKRKSEDAASVTVEEFEYLMRSYDKTYQYSNDPEIWKMGEAFYRFLQSVIRTNVDCGLFYTQNEEILGSGVNISKPIALIKYELYLKGVGDRDLRTLTNMVKAIEAMRDISTTAKEAGSTKLYYLPHRAPRWVNKDGESEKFYTLAVTRQLEQNGHTLSSHIERFIELLDLEPVYLENGKEYTLRDPLSGEPLTFTVLTDDYDFLCVEVGCVRQIIKGVRKNGKRNNGDHSA